ncbi:hypothetical protein FD755_024431, partial [Muntiacus reevesi]
ADATHMDGDQIVVEVQETVFVSDVVDSDITVHNFVPDDPDSVVIQDVIEDVVIEDVQCPDIMEEADVSETVIIPEQVLDSDVTEEVSLAHCTVPDDVLASDITSASMSMPEHVLTSESIHVSDIGHVEHIVHDSVVEAEIVTDPLTADVVSEEVLVADCASEAVIDANGIPVDQQEDDKGNCEDYLMISCCYEPLLELGTLLKLKRRKMCNQTTYILFNKMQKVMGEREPFQENGIVWQKRSWLLLRIVGTLECTCIFVHFLRQRRAHENQEGLGKRGREKSLESFVFIFVERQLYLLIKIFLLFIYFNWRIMTLQCCDGFLHTSKSNLNGHVESRQGKSKIRNKKNTLSEEVVEGQVRNS